MSTNIQRYENFDPSSVILSKMKKNKNGGKTVYINAPENKKLYLQLPFMRSPFGLSAFTDEATNRTSYSLDLSFDKDNEDACALMEKLSELDSKIISVVAENSKEWLGKPYNIEVIKEALYKPLVRPGKDDYWPKRMICLVSLSRWTVLKRVSDACVSWTSIRSGLSIINLA